MEEILSDHYLAGYFDGFGNFQHCFRENGNFKVRTVFRTECSSQALLFKNATGAETINFGGSYQVTLSKTKTIELLGRMGHLLIAKRPELEKLKLLQFVKQEWVNTPSKDYVCGYLDGRGSYIVSNKVGVLAITNKDTEALLRIKQYLGPEYFRSGMYERPIRSVLSISGAGLDRLISETYSTNSLNQRRREIILRFRKGEISLEEATELGKRVCVVKDESILTKEMNGEERRLDRIKRLEEKKRAKIEKRENKVRAYREGVEKREAERKAKAELNLRRREKARFEQKVIEEAERQHRLSSPDKYCISCEKEKPKTQFYVNNAMEDGLSSYCTECSLNKQRTVYKPTLRSYYLKNRDSIIKNQKSYLAKHKDKYRAWARMRNKRPEVRVRNNIKKRFKEFLKSAHQKKEGSINKYMGCTNHFLKEHLEKQFVAGMNWQNYGSKWHVDHILPISSFDMTKEEDRLQCCHFTNLRPLWAKDNMMKGARILSNNNLNPLDDFKGPAPTISSFP